MKVLGFGDNIVDRFIDRRVMYPGGNCVNFAVYARQLGAEAGYLGVFGSDDDGVFLQEAIAAADVTLHHCVTRDGVSGFTDITVEGGERVFGGWNGGGVTFTDPLILDSDILAHMNGFDLVHSSVYSGSESELPKLRALDSLVSFDLSSEDSYREPEYLDSVCPSIDLALVSASHLDMAQTKQLLVDVVNRGARLALATRGTAGAILWTGDEFVIGTAAAVADTDLVDTMGCGDAYVAAFAMAMLSAGWSRDSVPAVAAIQDSLGQAAAFAAQQCTVEGAFGFGRGY